MLSQEDEVLCSYPLWQKFWVFILVLPFALLSLFFAFRAVAGLTVAVLHLASGDPLGVEEFVGTFFDLVGVALVLMSFPALFLSMYSDLRLSERGIRVQVFWLWWILVPWEDVLDIRPTMQARLLGHRRSQLVFVRRLTFFHRFIGLFLGMTPKPAFNIKGTQRGYDDAVRLIKKRLGKE